MTNYTQVSNGKRSKRSNIKDGPRRSPVVPLSGFWGIEGFIPTSPNEWIFGWDAVNFPTFKVVEVAPGSVVATCGDVTRIFIDIRPSKIKAILDDFIHEMMEWDAEVDEMPGDWRPDEIVIDIDGFLMEERGEWVIS